jgi:hypothetical protein
VVLSRRESREACSRAPEFANYYIRLHGPRAEKFLLAKRRKAKFLSYHWILFWLATKSAKRYQLNAAESVQHTKPALTDEN